jgi:hypothetical protein
MWAVPITLYDIFSSSILNCSINIVSKQNLLQGWPRNKALLDSQRKTARSTRTYMFYRYLYILLKARLSLRFSLEKTEIPMPSSSSITMRQATTTNSSFRGGCRSNSLVEFITGVITNLFDVCNRGQYNFRKRRHH